MARKKVTDTVFELASPVAIANGCTVYDVEFKKEGADYVLRIIIDKEDNTPISIDQCESVSREMSDILDKVDPIDEPYMLEVSSPGIDRELKKEKDFIRFMGSDVDIKLYKAKDGTKLICGKLCAYDEGKLTVEVNNKQIEISKADYSSVRLSVKW